MPSSVSSFEPGIQQISELGLDPNDCTEILVVVYTAI